jgi:hypothetical protein
MLAALTGIGSTIANSRVAQYAVGIGLFIVGFLWWLADRDDKLLKNERLKAERKARIKQDEIRKRNAVKSAEVADARESAPVDIPDSDSVRDPKLRAVLFGD